MNVTAEFTPTIMDGAVVRFKIGDRYEVNASRNGVSASGPCPMLTEIGDVMAINNLFLAAWYAYQQMRARPDEAYETGKLIAEQMNKNLHTSA
jgi:hypothetical protein